MLFGKYRLLLTQGKEHVEILAVLYLFVKYRLPGWLAWPSVFRYHLYGWCRIVAIEGYSQGNRESGVIVTSFGQLL